MSARKPRLLVNINDDTSGKSQLELVSGGQLGYAMKA